MSQPDPQTMTTMASYARHRAALWRLLTDVVGPVTEDLLTRAIDGRLARDVETAAHFIGDTNPFSDVLPTRRDVFEHSRHTDVDAERSRLADDLTAAHDDSLTRIFADARAACDDEADAWEAGDAPAAKEARLRQFTTLDDQLQPLTDWCVRLYRRAGTEPTRMVARIVAAHLSLESGSNVKAQLTDY